MKKRHDPVLQMVREKRGTATRIAEACGIKRATVWVWQRVPPQHVLAVEELLQIPRHKIRPDLYPPPNEPGTQRWLNNNGRKQHVRA